MQWWNLSDQNEGWDHVEGEGEWEDGRAREEDEGECWDTELLIPLQSKGDVEQTCDDLYHQANGQ